MIISSLDNQTLTLIKEINPTEIIFMSHFNEYIREDIFPKSVNKIIFGLKHYQSDYEYSIEKLIQEEELVQDDNSFSKFNSNSINNLNKYIKWILFPYDSTFNQNIPNLPSSLEFLGVGKNCSKSLANLPLSLRYFFLMSDVYNKTIMNLSNTIEYIGIKTQSDMLLSKLPSNTKYLELDTVRYQNVVISNNKALDLLPEKIESINLTCCYNSELKNLPVNLKKLKIWNLADPSTLVNLPQNLIYLDVTFKNSLFNLDKTMNYFSNLPFGIKHLCITSDCFHLDEITTCINLSYLPDSLEYLELCNLYLDSHTLDNLPIGLETLKIINCVSAFTLESGVKVINITNNLPRMLKYLHVYIVTNIHKKKILLSNLPDTLESLHICPDYELDKSYSNLDIKIDYN